MNAYKLYDAAFDSACDFQEPTSEYITGYADGAFDTAISNDTAELIASKRREWLALVEAGEADSNEFWHRIQKPLEEIEII